MRKKLILCFILFIGIIVLNLKCVYGNYGDIQIIRQNNTDITVIYSLKCPLCGKTDYNFGKPDKNNHNSLLYYQGVLPSIVTKTKTCTEDGYKAELYICSNTSKHSFKEFYYISKGNYYNAGHNYSFFRTIEPTCTEAGYNEYKCSVCGKTKIEELIPALGHKWNSGIITKQSTCTDTGIKEYTCRNNSSHKKTENIPELGHDLKATIINPTCTEKGYTLHSCTRQGCSYSYKDNYKNALGHNYQVKEVVKPTCTEGGYTLKKCSRCNASITDNRTNALGHNFVNGVCSRCGAKDPNYTPSNPGHICEFEEATCEKPKTCKYCGTTEGSKLGHNFVNHKCTRCNKLECEFLNQHIYDNNNICESCQKTKCQIEGHKFKNNVCEVCGITKCQNNGNHNYVEGICSICGAKETEGVLKKWKIGDEVWAWLYETGKLEIKGEGSLYDYIKDESNNQDNVSPLRKDDNCRLKIKDIEITGNVTNIGAYLFYYCTSIQSIKINNPDSITKIGEGAFFGCVKLSKFIMPKNVTNIGPRAFCHCEMLGEIDLSNCSKLKVIGHEAFRDCWHLQTVEMPEVKNPGDGLRVIGYWAFFNCINLKNVFLPTTLVAIGTKGISENETGIGQKNQETAENLATLNSDGYNSVFGIDFRRNTGTALITALNVILGQNGIIDVNNGRSITLDEETREITGLTEEEIVLLQKFMTKTRVYYYSDIANLMGEYNNAQEEKDFTELVISETRWDIGIEKGSVTAVLDKTGKLTISGTGATKNYVGFPTPWKEIRGNVTSLDIDEGITILGDYLFYYNNIQGEVILPSTLKEIHYGVFFGCRNITKINLPDNLEFIGGRAFCHAEKLEEITLPEGITALKGETFRDCYKLEKVEARGEIKAIGYREFFNSPSLKTIFTIAPELQEIGEEVFSVDFTGDSYLNANNYKESYNNGDYEKLTINYYEDCAPMVTFAESNATKKREFNKINIQEIAIKEGYRVNYREEDELEKPKIIVTYEDETTREIDGNIEEVTYKINNETIADNKLPAGEDEIKVTYYNKIATFNVTVKHIWNQETGKCTKCGADCEHKYITLEKVEPTCEEEGYEEVQCEECGFENIINREEALGHNYVNGICTRCGEKEKTEEVFYIETEKYEVEEETISKIQPHETIEEFINNIMPDTNAIEIKIYKGENEVNSTEKIGTGMEVRFTLNGETKTYTVIVSGDTNGDGEANFKDMIKINKHRLGKTKLTGAYEKAADVNNDGNLSFKDIVKINKFRLKKIEIL